MSNFRAILLTKGNLCINYNACYDKFIINNNIDVYWITGNTNGLETGKDSNIVLFIPFKFKTLIKFIVNNKSYIIVFTDNIENIPHVKDIVTSIDLTEFPMFVNDIEIQVK